MSDDDLKQIEALIEKHKPLIPGSSGCRPEGEVVLLSSAMLNDLMALSLAWEDRAQKCRDEGMKCADDYGERRKKERLVSRAETLDYCAQELKIALQIQDL